MSSPIDQLAVPAETPPPTASAASTVVDEPLASNDQKKSVDEKHDEVKTTTEHQTADASSDVEKSLPSEQVDDDGEYPTGIKMFFIVVALLMAMFLIALDMTIVATAIPKITDEFGGLEKVGWYGASFFMTVGAFQSTWGKIYKYFPLKTSFMIAILIFEVGSVICGAAPDANSLIAGRAIAGVGAAGVGAGCYTIIAFAASPKNRPAFTGILGAGYGLASVCGPLLGGAFTDHVSWRWCFYINLPIGGVAALIIFFFFQTPQKAIPVPASLFEKIRQMDLIGVALIMAATVCYILGVEYGGIRYDWGHATVIGLLVGFVAIMGVWAVLQWYQGDYSMVPPRLLKDRTVAVMSAFAFVFAGTFFAAIYYIPIYFQSVHGTSPTMSGVRNLPMIITVTIGTIASGVFVTAKGYYQPMLISGVMLACIGSGLLYMLDIDTDMGKWIGYQILAGFGWGVAFQIPMIATQGSIDASDLAPATGIILFFQGLGGAFFVSGAQSAFMNQMSRYILTRVADVDRATLIMTGATNIRGAFTGATQAIVIEGYMHGLQVVFAMCIAGTGIATIISLLVKWNKLNQANLTGAA